MQEWFGQHLWAVWLGLALLLGTTELFTGDLIFLMLASGALAWKDGVASDEYHDIRGGMVFMYIAPSSTN